MSVEGGFGAKLKITVSAVLTVVANMEDVEFPTVEQVMTEITAHDSADGYQEFIPSGLVNTGEITGTITYDTANATHEALVALSTNKTVNAMQIESPTGSETVAFNGYVSAFNRLSPKDGAFRAQIKIRPTGVFTYGP